MFQVFASISGGYLIVLIFIFEVLDRIRQKKISGGQNISDKDGAIANGKGCEFIVLVSGIFDVLTLLWQ